MLPRSCSVVKFLLHHVSLQSNKYCTQLYLLHLGCLKRSLSYERSYSCNRMKRGIYSSILSQFHLATLYNVQQRFSSNECTKDKTKSQKSRPALSGEEKIECKEGSHVTITTLHVFTGTDLDVDIDENTTFPPQSPPLIAPNKQIRVNLAVQSMERNFITPVRAMSDFLLKPSELVGLRKIKRRSPYESEPPITVLWRKDVEAKALEVWGSQENLLRELLFRDAERKRYNKDIFSLKKRLKENRKERAKIPKECSKECGILGSSGRVVLTAIVINFSNFLFKLFAWLHTGSHSMFSECIHSLADTINQLILAFGIHKSTQNADTEHPYGYSNMKYVASLISGVGIFCVGTGLSIYHGTTGLLHPLPPESFYWAFVILGGSFLSEGATLLIAVNSICKGAKVSGMSFTEYVVRGQDPSVNVVLMEDFAAVISVLVAGTCMGLTSHYGNSMPDAIGSLLVGGILGGVASFIIYTNIAFLVGRSISQDRLDKINAELEADVMIRAIHDVKGIDMGNCLVRYKAEMDFDGWELTRSYLDKLDICLLYQEIRDMQTINELELFLLKHGENIVDMMGGEIDRIERRLRKEHPEIRHCDLEIL